MAVSLNYKAFRRSLRALGQSVGSGLIGFRPAGTAASNRTVQDKLRDVVSVTDFGADPTGVTDSTSAFQAAHDSLTNGGSIFIPDGEYLLNQTAQATQFAITKSNITVFGNGARSVLKHTATGVVADNQAVVMLRPSSGTIRHISLRNFRIEGGSASSGSTATNDNRVMGICLHDGVSNGDVTDVLVDGVIVEKMESVCFGITTVSSSYAVQRAIFSNCTGKNGRLSGINDFGGNGTDIKVLNCIFEDLDGFGAEMACTSLEMDSNTIRRCGQAGIGLEYNPTLGANARRTIRNNTISDIGNATYTTAPGITCGQSQNPFNTEIHGNTISRTKGHGISVLLTPSYISIHDNDIYDVGGGASDTRGVHVPGNATYTTVKSNTIITTAVGYTLTTGVAIAGTGSITNLIENNTVVGHTTSRVFAQAPTRVSRGLPPFMSFTQGQNVGVGEDDMVSFTLPANTMEQNTQGIRIRGWGITEANANNKQVKLYFGNLQLIASGSVAANNKSWFFEAAIYRTDTTNIEGHARGQFNGSDIQVARITSINRDFTIANTIKFTGEATTTGDIVQTGMSVEFLDSNSWA